MSKQVWNAPDGSQVDFRQTFFDGQSMPVAWTACNNSIDDIWITSFDEDAFAYSHLLKSMFPKQPERLGRKATACTN